MTTMLEKAARAIANAEACGGWDAATPDWRDTYRACARAALLAIREADGRAIAAGAAENWSLTYGVGHMDADPCEVDEAAADMIFTAMIDAILNDHGSSADPDTHREAEQPVVAPIEAVWQGDDDVLPRGMIVDVLASDPRPGRVINGRTLTRLPGHTACWVRCTADGAAHPMYRSCDLSDLDLSDKDFDLLSALSTIPNEKPGP